MKSQRLACNDPPHSGVALTHGRSSPAGVSSRLAARSCERCSAARSGADAIPRRRLGAGASAPSAPPQGAVWRCCLARSRPDRRRPDLHGARCARACAACAAGRLAAGRATAASRSQSEVDERSEDLRRALSELEIAQAETVRRLSMAVEFRDEDTGAHIERIGRFSTLLAEAIGMSAGVLPAHRPRRTAARRRQGRDPRRDPAEARLAHARGASDRRDPRRGGPPPAARLLLLDPRHGRDDRPLPPRALGRRRLPARSSAENIPIEGRIVAIADVFDALTSHRVYRDAFSVREGASR